MCHTLIIVKNKKGGTEHYIPLNPQPMYFKGTVDIISCNFYWKECYQRFTTVLFKPLSHLICNVGWKVFNSDGFYAAIYAVEMHK